MEAVLVVHVGEDGGWDQGGCREGRQKSPGSVLYSDLTWMGIAGGLDGGRGTAT